MKLGIFFALLVSVLHANEPPPVLEIGADAPEFTLPGIDGRDWALSDFEDAKVLCVIFTCNHCPDAYAARGRMRKIHADYKDKGVALVAINGNNPIGLRPDELGYSPYGDSFEEMKPFAEESGWDFPYLYDGETQAVTMAYGAQSTPHVFVFGPERKLRYTGRMDDARRSAEAVEKSYLREALDAVLAGEAIETPKTRSFGCSTKWLWKKEEVVADQARWEKLPVMLDDMDAALAKEIRLNESETVRLVNFWSTTCSPCLAEFPDLIETYRRFQNRNFDLVTISLDPADEEAKVRKILNRHHAAVSPRVVPALRKEDRRTINYRFAGENPDELAEAIDPKWQGAMPHTVILSPDGEIVWRHTGRFDPVELRRQILKALDAAG